MRKPENTFIDSVHKRFASKEAPHREKMNNPYRSGTADCYYSGEFGDVWIEYKWVPKLPTRTASITPDCSPLQIKWLHGRYSEGRNVHVIVGCPAGGVILSGLEWEAPIPVSDFTKRIISREAIAEWLTLQTRGSVHANRRQPRNLRHTLTAAACDEQGSQARARQGAPDARHESVEEPADQAQHPDHRRRQ